MPTISAYMDVANTFIPTAGVVGLLPMVTYFFLVVALFAFLGTFIFSMAMQASTLPASPGLVFRVTAILTAIIAAVAGLTYYVTQSYYHDMLAELATVSDLTDRRTLIRESYNAIGQYRYMAWFITTPLVVFQLISLLKIRLSKIKRPLAGLMMASTFMAFASYIGHQQLSFDNEIQVGSKLTWGFIALIDYVFILFTLNRLEKEFGGSAHATFRATALTLVTIWGIYLAGYFLTVIAIDFNWLHLVFTIADMVSIPGTGMIVYLAHTNRWNTSLRIRPTT